MGCINEITGHTKLTGLLGSPVAHSKSPLMHNESFRQLDLDYVYLCFDVPENDLKTAFEGLKKLNVLTAQCLTKLLSVSFWMNSHLPLL